MGITNKDIRSVGMKGFDSGEEAVLQFLNEMKELDLKEEYESWANADKYTKLNGEVIDRCE